MLREEHIQQVAKQNVERELARTQRIEHARAEKEVKLQEQTERRFHDLTLTKEE